MRRSDAINYVAGSRPANRRTGLILTNPSVSPANAGVHKHQPLKIWTPAFAGVTRECEAPKAVHTHAA